VLRAGVSAAQLPFFIKKSLKKFGGLKNNY
jgi:hypothetical protein